MAYQIPGGLHKLQRKVTDFILRAAEWTIGKYGAENCSLDCGVPMESNQLISVRMFDSTQRVDPRFRVPAQNHSRDDETGSMGLRSGIEVG